MLNDEQLAFFNKNVKRSNLCAREADFVLECLEKMEKINQEIIVDAIRDMAQGACPICGWSVGLSGLDEHKCEEQ